MTAVHLINRLPLKVIGLLSSLELIDSFLENVKLQNGLKPRVFECVVFIHTHNMSSDKLLARAIWCVFVGYLATQKGYRCYDSTSQRFFVTKDAFFDENTFFYASSPSSNSTLPSSLDCYQLPPADNESKTSRTKASLPVQYPDSASGTSTSDQSSDPRIPEQNPINLSHQSTSFTYFPEYYVRHNPTKDDLQEPVSHPSTKNFSQFDIPLAL